MPENVKNPESTWITVQGKHVEVEAGEDIADKIREKLPSARGEKEKNTKETLSKEYTKRYNYQKSIFQSRDEVVYDEYKKSGVVAGVDGDVIKILNEGRIVSIHKNGVFKKSELIDGVHWDSMSKEYRIYCLNKVGIGSTYLGRNWMELQPNIRIEIRKINSPAGYESTSSGVGNPIFNPINEDKTVSQRIKEEEEKQHEENKQDNKGADEKSKQYS